MTPEDREDIQRAMREGLEQMEKTGDPSWAYGLKALGVEPAAIEAAFAVGAQMAKQGFHDKAFEYFSGLQQLDPANFRVYQWLGYLSQLKRNHVLAYQLFLYGCYFNPSDPVLRISLGESMLMIDESPVNGVAQITYGLQLAGDGAKLAAHVKRGQSLLAAVKEREAGDGK